jgi:hypothetical protein
MHAIFFDQVRTLAKPPVVLRIVPARLDNIIAQHQVHFIAHLLFVVNLGALRDRLVNEGVSVLALPFIFEIPGLMVDTRAGVIDLGVRRADPPGEHHCCALHGMTQARYPDEGLLLIEETNMAIGLV